MYVLSTRDIAGLLPIDAALSILRQAFIDDFRGASVTPDRTIIDLPAGEAVFMPSFLGATGDFGLKVLSYYPENPGLGRPANQSVVVLFDPQTGAPAAVLEADLITVLRTGIVAGLGVEALACPDGRTLAVLGSGPIAYWSVVAACAVRDIETIAIWSRRRQTAEALLGTLQSTMPSLRGRVATTPREAVEGSDVVVTATSSRSALVDNEDVAPGTHISSVGEHELGPELLAAARLIVDRSPNCLSEASDVSAAIEGGWLEAGVAVELGGVLAGESEGRTSVGDKTILKAAGVGFQDVAIASALFRRYLAACEPGSPPGGGGT